MLGVQFDVQFVIHEANRTKYSTIAYNLEHGNIGRYDVIDHM